MITVRQHVPGWIDGVAPLTVSVRSLEELQAVPFVAVWMEDMQQPVRRFERFSLSHYGAGRRLLMAEYDGGSYWWVVAYLSGSVEALGLPTWVHQS